MENNHNSTCSPNTTLDLPYPNLSIISHLLDFPEVFGQWEPLDFPFQEFPMEINSETNMPWVPDLGDPQINPNLQLSSINYAQTALSSAHDETFAHGVISGSVDTTIDTTPGFGEFQSASTTAGSDPAKTMNVQKVTEDKKKLPRRRVLKRLNGLTAIPRKRKSCEACRGAKQRCMPSGTPGTCERCSKRELVCVHADTAQYGSQVGGGK